MKFNRVPLRKCIACGERKPKDSLIRIVKSKNNESELDIFVCNGHAEGRGAYLCKNIDCFNKAKKARRLERAFSCRVDSVVYDGLEKVVSNLEQ